MNLPKNFQFWAQNCGLTPESNSVYYYTGFGRHWRVSCYGEFQMSVPFADFDKWANSLDRGFPIPKSQKEFEKLMKKVLTA